MLCVVTKGDYGMKKQIQYVLATMVVSLFMCQVASAQVTNWANESAGNGYQYCASGTVAIAIQCRGGYCAEIRGDCNIPLPSLTGTNYNTPTYSEEQGRFYCSAGYVVGGFDVSGWDNRGDNISLNCAQVSPSWTEDICVWTDWFSDEVTGSAPAVQDPPTTGYAGDYVYCPANTYVHGMECDGGWCDYMRLNCCSYKIVTPPTGIDLGILNTRTNFTVDVTQALFIDELTFSGWTPTKIVVGIGSSDGRTMNGMTVSVNGGVPIALTGYWQQIEIPFVGQSLINLTVSDPAAGTRAMQIQWWAQ
jgi:hypothetical protein